MRQSTDPKDHAWLARCRYDHCDSEKIKCPVCKKPGHVTIHVTGKNKYGQVIVTITTLHAHFLEDIDAGRNMYCETEYSEFISPIEAARLNISYSVTAQEKKSLIKKYNGILK